MTSKERVLERQRKMGREAALSLASRASMLNGTQLIDEQDDIPMWSETAIYTVDHVGYPVQDLDQVYTILQPHTPAHNPGVRPADLPAIYSIQHTKDPTKAKPYLPSHGTSGMYMLDEVCTKDGSTWRSTKNDNPYPPNEIGTEDFWEIVE